MNANYEQICLIEFMKKHELPAMEPILLYKALILVAYEI